MKPDWRRKDQYPNRDTTSMACWAWEFLRRNPSYVKDYETYVALPYWIKDFYYGRPEPPESEDLSLQGFFTCYPAALPGDTVRSYLSRHPKGHIDPPDYSISVKYGLEGLVNPQEDYSDRVVFRNDQWPGMYARQIESVLPTNLGLRGLGLPEPFLEWAVVEPFRTEEIAVIFSLALPLEVQIHRAESNLKSLRAKLKAAGAINPKAKRRQDYRLYLQVLDAVKAGCSVAEIGEHFHPTIDNEYPDYRRNTRVRDDLTAAEALRDSDYLYLLSLDHKRLEK